MSLKTQAKILRILEEQRFERVGGSRPIQVDVRIVAATNKNLEEEIPRGAFREDLYHRINVIPLHVPPLRERQGDIPLLTGHFLKELAQENEAPLKTLTPEVLAALTARPWPGNVRELKNFLARLAILAPGDNITLQDLDLADPGSVAALAHEPESFFTENSFRDARALFEKEFLRRKLEEHGGNVSATAEAVGLERSHLYRKLKGYGLEAGKEEG